MAAERGCGSRVAGGLYLEIPTSENGLPIQYFLVDPPVRTSVYFGVNHVGLPSKGVTLHHQEGEENIVRILDVVGKDSYPTPADFIQEAGKFGISRRISRRIDLTGVGPNGWLCLFHDRAWSNNMSAYGVWICPHASRSESFSPGSQRIAFEHHPDMIAADNCCAGFWWQDVPHNPTTGYRVIHNRLVKRKMPSLEYSAYLRPEGIQESDYEQAMFAVFPLHMANLAVVKGEGDEESLAAAQRGGLPILEVDE
jgi:hypothetical protein